MTGLLIFALLVAAIPAFIHLPGGQRRLERLFKVPENLELANFDSLTPGTKPNFYIVLPPTHSDVTGYESSEIYHLNTADLRKRIIEIVLGNPNVIDVRRDDSLLQNQFVQRTSYMRFPDIIDVRIYDLGDNTSALGIYSRSVFGYSDAGVNKKRVEDWLSNLATQT